jgi:FAD/FMN-containing dehydrogenase/Fe-S oxidoreductase
MTTRPPDVPRDPSVDNRADYDYRGGDDPAAEGNETRERAALARELTDRIEGEVRFDEYSRSMYATDASVYRVPPVGVVFPTSTADVSAVVETCATAGVAVLPRGGGTSLAGQSVNEAVVIDFTRHMDAVLDVDPETRRARAQPGTVLGELNAAAKPFGLKFAPDPAWGDRSALGGAIGNNSTGAHSLQYGKTDAYIQECEVVLADGTVTTLGEVDVETVRKRADPDGDLLERIHAAVRDVLDGHADAVRERYPDLKRNVSGYNLDVLVEEADSGTVNLARLLAGSEGTLAVVTEATVGLESLPETKAVALLSYPDLGAAMADVAPILDHDPAAVEVLDDVLLELAADRPAFSDLVGMLPEGTDSLLLVEFYAENDDDGRRKVAGLLADRTAGVDAVADPPDDAVRTDDPVRTVGALEAHDETERKRFWKLRKSGLPILLSRTTDDKHISFIEDTAVPPEALPEFVAGFRSILDDHDTEASFYAHAGPGVLHIRPLVDTKTVEGVETMESIAEAVTDLVVDHGGSVSGEHGDGRARTRFNRKLYGDDLWEVFRDLKTAFDPDWLLNPGQVCGDVSMTDRLRFDPDYEWDPGFSPTLEWDVDNGMQGMVELCHGCGGCRGGQDTVGGVMCPTYRAAEEESLSTRGRANMLREAMSGGLDADELLEDEFVEEVLDLCIGCKGCAHDCPSGVDLAKLKAEVTHAHHQEHGASLRDRVFSRIDELSDLGSALAPVSNWATSVPGAGALAERLLGVAREREVPGFRRETFSSWLADRGSTVTYDEARRVAVLFPDTYTDHNHPETGKAAVRALEAAGVRVELADGVTGSGRPPHSKGFLDLARERARQNVDALAPVVEDGRDVVVVEPSDAVMVQSDYLDLLAGDGVERVAANTYGVCEYLDRFDLLEDLPANGSGELTYHGHCHQKAYEKDVHAARALRAVGYEVDALDSGCCGMAGSFGYEAEHLSMSRAIYNLLDRQLRDSSGETVVASGTSCRTQIDDFGDVGDPDHPIEKVAAALR